MDPVTILGVASGIASLVDFVSKLISNTLQIYNSKKEASESAVELRDVALNLRELSQQLDAPLSSRSGRQRRQDHQPANPAEAKLLDLRKESDDIAKKLLDAIDEMFRDPTKRRGCFRQALVKVWKERTKQNLKDWKGWHNRIERVRSLEKKIEKIRKQLDTTLLTCLRHQIQHLTKDVRNGEDDDLRHYIMDSRQWQADLLAQIQRLDDQAGLRTLSGYLHNATEEAKRQRFCKLLLGKLDYLERRDREEDIHKAYQGTFDWLFGSSEMGFSNWLSGNSDERIYWITGKPGSGKSTLMKYISTNEQTKSLLKIWAKQRRLVMANFYFWNSGTKKQMSDVGLLQTLLYQILEKNSSLAMIAFEQRWNLFDTNCGGIQPPAWKEMKRAFENIISNKSLRFFFLVDGLDEFDGDHRALVDLILDAAKLPNVKICAASRPWLLFEDAFGNRPSLLMEDLTKNDIRKYVSGKFEESQHFSRLKNKQPSYANKLVKEVTKKALGVFLWVYLVVDSLLQGISNADHISDLQRRLDSSPASLEALFENLLGNLDPFYHTSACQLIKIIASTRDPLTILELSFADGDDPMSAMTAPLQPISDSDQIDRSLEMRRRVYSRCRGFIEIREARGWFPSSKVRFLHRTAKDFIMQQYWDQILEATNGELDANLALGNAALHHLKIKKTEYLNWQVINRSIDLCVHYIDQLDQSENEFQLLYLDELNHVISMKARVGDEEERRLTWLTDYTLHHRAANPTLIGYACTKIRAAAPLGREEAWALLALRPNEVIVQTIKESTKAGKTIKRFRFREVVKNWFKFYILRTGPRELDI